MVRNIDMVMLYWGEKQVSWRKLTLEEEKLIVEDPEQKWLQSIGWMDSRNGIYEDEREEEEEDIVKITWAAA